MGAQVHFLISVLELCRLCAYCHSLCELICDQPSCAWKMMFTWCDTYPLALAISPLLHRPLSLEARGWIKTSHLGEFFLIFFFLLPYLIEASIKITSNFFSVNFPNIFIWIAWTYTNICLFHIHVRLIHSEAQILFPFSGLKKLQQPCPTMTFLP